MVSLKEISIRAFKMGLNEIAQLKSYEKSSLKNKDISIEMVLFHFFLQKIIQNDAITYK